MNKTYREWSPDQAYMFPPSPRDWLPEDDLVYFIVETVATLDLSPIFAHYERELRGQPPFHPRMMVALLLYCYATGTRSSRKIMRRCQTDVACRVIVGEDVPDFRTISDFRKTHLARLEGLFLQVLKLCADTAIQVDVDDALRGHVFAVQDSLFWVAFIGAITAAAAVIPSGGHSTALVIAGTGLYLCGLAAHSIVGRR